MTDIFSSFKFVPEYTSSCNDNTTIVQYRHGVVGSIYILHGIFYIVPYLPCLLVIARPPLITKPCYKIIFIMGILDLTNLSTSALLSGYYSIIGATVCSHTISMISAGYLSVGNDNTVNIMRCL
jgi:hypothetical protein